MTCNDPCYAAYMMRLWQAGDEASRTWRASLESPHTGEVHVFTDLSALFAFLEQKTRELGDSSATRRSDVS